MSTPVVVWGVLYLVSRLGGISSRRFQPLLRVGFVVLMGVSLLLFVFDRTLLSDVVAIHAWGLFAAEMWIGRHHKRDAPPLVTSLKL
jgi:hypothetical protein